MSSAWNSRRSSSVSAAAWMPPVSLYRSPRPNSSLKSTRRRSGAGGSPRVGACATACGSARKVDTAPHPEASTRLRFSDLTAATRSGFTSAQNPRSGAQGRSFTRSSSDSMYPSPWSHPVASSSSWSGVHIHVTAGSLFTSSHTGISSTTADSASMRPRRDPGVWGFPECESSPPDSLSVPERGDDLNSPSPEGRGGPGVRSGSGSGISGSGFTEIFRIDMRPLLHAHRVQRDPARQLWRDSFPHVHRQRFPRREPAPGAELGQRLVDAPAVEPPGDFLGEQVIQGLEAHHAPCVRGQRPLHRDVALVTMPVLGRCPAELPPVPLVGPVRAPDVVRSAKLNDTRKIAHRHR